MSRLIWVRSEILDHAVFNTSIRWTATKVLEFLTSLRTAVGGSTGGLVTRERWISLATKCCSPAMMEADALAYWHVFVGGLQRPVSAQMDAEGFDIRALGLFLMCQIFGPLRARSDLQDQFAKSGEMWPGFERATALPVSSSPRHSPRGAAGRATPSAQGLNSRVRADWGAAMITFVRQHLGNFLQVVSGSLEREPVSVRSEELDMLGLILCAGVSYREPLKSLSEAIPELVSRRSMNSADVKAKVIELLVWNKELYSWDDQFPGQANLARNVYLCGLTRTTWFQKPADVEIDVLRIAGCSECTIYVTGNVNYCFITNCHQCTIIMTAVSRVCKIHVSEALTIHVASHCFSMENCTNSFAYVYCHIPPILTGDSRGLTLAPFNVLYSEMDVILQRAGMMPQADFIDRWAHPVCCTLGIADETMGSRGANPEDQDGTYQFVHPETFGTVVIPEDILRRVQSPLCLPQVYAEGLQNRQEVMRTFQSLFTEVADDTQRRKAHQAIQGHFREWLASTGKNRQLMELAREVALP